ncbi:MAG: YggS family pyridoxal phosphate-dependent enzyme [Magnetococcales bacterium]|nr:YggS family pyridoxal phosphate-dependent enzyme [Magnetococcales bacterium]
MSLIADQLAMVRRRMAAACERAGREVASVRLVAVSKHQPAAAVGEALAAGQTLFGENYVQEAREKISQIAGTGGSGAGWHLIGPLQRNKAKEAARLFDMVESLDALPLAEELSRRRLEFLATPLPVLMQINIGNEPQKAGFSPEEAAAAALHIAGLPGLRLRGLMAIPPFTPTAEEARPYFRALRRLAEALRETTGMPLEELSMGMSQDYEIALEEGATLVRVGSAIFGSRG